MTTLGFIKFDSRERQFHCGGEWNITSIPKLQNEISALSWPSSGEMIVDGSAITQMDSAGAWLINQLVEKLAHHHITAHLENVADRFQTLITIVDKEGVSHKKLPVLKRLNWLGRVGQSAIVQLIEARDFLAFVGKLGIEALHIVTTPRRIRLGAVVDIIYKTGYQALPIIALLSFMIGVVLTYQMGVQLKNYGANIFIVDLLGLSVLREFGPLLTAIMIAGRTGSAFTAELGTMKVNREIDVLNTMGVTPAELLLLPRIIGLVIALPLLTMWADMFGVLGGMIMSKDMLGIHWQDFLLRFEQQIPVRALLIGLGKAPVFALIIASIGCFEGMQVKGSADSVGKQTTRSVVWAIFFIIVADAIFSILFSKLKL